MVMPPILAAALPEEAVMIRVRINYINVNLSLKLMGLRDD